MNSTQKPQVLAITGGIGSGKSTVRKQLENAGFPSIDLDQISRNLVAPNSPGLVKIVAFFGSAILQNGELNRKALKQRIFESPEEKAVLESILHPLIRQATLDKLAALTYHPWVVIEIPLLAEVGKPDYVDQVVVCDCQESTQIRRVQERDGLDLSLIQKIIQNQAKRSERLALADWVLNTDLTPKALKTAVEELSTQLKDLASLG